MSPLSDRADARSRQLANLKRGGNPVPGGNRIAETHGAYSQIAKAELDGKLAEIHDALALDAPVREVDGGLPAADGPVIRLAAEALCRLDRIGEYLERRGWQDDSGKPRPVLDYEARLRGHALDLLKELGMTPASRAKLGLDLVRTADLASQWAAEGDQSPTDDVIDTEATDA
jgi:hypothetical protein